VFSEKTGDRLAWGSVIVALLIGFYTYSFLPVIDFLAYKVGANIPNEMITPPGAQPDVFEITYQLKNKKSGETKTMTDKEYLKSNIWKDNDWTVVGTPESRLVKKGFTPKIIDLSIKDAQGNDYTKELLANPFNNLFIVAYDLNKTNLNGLGNLNALAVNLHDNFNTRTILLTSNSHTDAEAFAKKNHLVMEIFYVDEVPLKEMVRANPGVLLLKNGTIINKWHYHSIPKYDDLVKEYFQK
jgi:hypothetical protein